mmetsp:Transcript_29212/g.26599  ORF Transcript_29212/g.26599 Transcript_29212/m.26599 type:complete len:150 (+) Transcript_29212:1572-2021(+)|eukprot:CAMPEP_0114595182 /NCGR_PEP_ID=MMETSP0125-20121206/16947_1 /TAXON_ID=485358 ORGANISM="Aristerostoma sp., Strain ATCC 50986" /NCGR_SAMPLE_ID=MMETSP0125 /ASSEMBLY_ACC=CAM_ASM_000245 /LENGTH=149 /DNA_ID=CAMNT_0001796447 /DNA_START=1545 /DNA_END=1994 /DNA_ORIENTATION=-
MLENLKRENEELMNSRKSNANANEEVALLRKNVNEKNEKIEYLCETNEKLNNEYETLKQNHNNLKKELQESKQNESKMSSDVDSKIASLKDEVEALRKKDYENQQQIMRLEEDQARQRRNYEDLKMENQKNLNLYQALKGERDDAMSQS